MATQLTTMTTSVNDYDVFMEFYTSCRAAP